MAPCSLVEEAWARRSLPAPEERRRIRQASGVSLRRLGREVGVTAQAVALWETGRRDPRGENLVAYVGVLADLAAVADLAARAGEAQ